MFCANKDEVSCGMKRHRRHNLRLLPRPRQQQRMRWSTVRSLHTTLEEFKNAAFFLRLGLPSTLIRHENAALFLRLGPPSTLIRQEKGAFRKRWSNRRNLKTQLCVLVWTETVLKTEPFENDDVMIITWFSCRSFPQKHKSKLTVFSNFSGVVCPDGKSLMHF